MGTKGSFLKFKADIWPVTTICIGLLLSLLPFIFQGPSMLMLASVGVGFRILVPIHQHYHSHLSTFRSEIGNFIYDIILSLTGGNLTALWKVHHGLGHHVEYLDQKKDLEGNLRFGTNIKARRFVFTVLGDFLSLYDSLKFLNGFSKTIQKKYRGDILRQFCIQIMLFAVLFLISWKLTLLIFIVPNLFLRWAVFWFSYGQHDELPMTGVYDSSTTRFHLNFILLNVGLHTAHHEKPGLHWSLLPKRTKEILPLIDPVCLTKRFGKVL